MLLKNAAYPLTPMISYMFRNLSFFATMAAIMASSSTASAQDYPDSVDIDLRRSTLDTNNLEVLVRANGLGFSDVFSGLTFTVRWATTSPATLGPRVNNCPDGIGVAPTPQITNPDVDGVPTGFNYRTYNAFGTSLLSDWGCALPQDEWYLVTTIPVVGNDGCTVFQVVNDSFTSSPGNARDFFVSLGGYDLTGTIEEEPVSFGACGAVDCSGIPGGTALPGTPCDDGDPETVNDSYNDACDCAGVPNTVDCLGVPGGTALPGTACNDNNPDTEGDVYDDMCLCAGIPMGVGELAGKTGMSLLPNPSTVGAVVLRMDGINDTDGRMAGINVLDARGQRVFSALANINGGTVNHRLEIGHLAAGPYLVQVTVAGKRSAQRLVIQ